MYKLVLHYADRTDEYEFYSDPYHIGVEIASETPELVGFVVSGQPTKPPPYEPKRLHVLNEKFNKILDGFGYESVFDIADYIRKHNPELYKEIIDRSKEKIETQEVRYNYVSFGEHRWCLPRPPQDKINELILEHIERIKTEND